MDPSNNDESKHSTTGDGSVVDIGGISPPDGGAGGAIVAGKRRADTEVEDKSDDVEVSTKRVRLSFSQKMAKFGLKDRDMASISKEIALQSQEVRTQDQIDNSAKGIQLIVGSGLEGEGLSILLKNPGKGTIVTNFGRKKQVERPAQESDHNPALLANYRIQIDPNPPFDPANNCTGIRLSSGSVADSSGSMIGVNTYRVMTPEEFSNTVRRSSPGAGDNFGHGFITKHVFHLTVEYTPGKQVKTVLSPACTSSNIPAKLSATRENLFQKPKLAKYGVTQMYGILMPDRSFLIVGSSKELQRAISRQSVAILPETSNPSDFNEKASSLAFHMPHDHFDKSVNHMCYWMSKTSTAMCFKWREFQKWVQKAKESSAVIYRFSFFSEICKMNRCTPISTEVRNVFSNCIEASQLRLYSVDNLNFYEVPAREKTVKKSKREIKSQSCVWNSFEFGNMSSDSNISHFFSSAKEYFRHFGNHVATPVETDGKTVLSRGVKKMSAVLGSWPPFSSENKTYVLTNNFDAAIQLISWTGPEGLEIVEDMPEQLQKTTDAGGAISAITMMAAVALEQHRRNTIPKQCVYPDQHCFSPFVGSKIDLLSISSAFFLKLREFTFKTITAVNMFDEIFEDTDSKLYCNDHKMFVKFFLHFVFAVVFNHVSCDTETDLYFLCKNNFQTLQTSCVYGDTSLSSDHKMIFSRYFLLSIMMTILRTIDVLLFIPKKIPLHFIKVDGYNRDTPWYMLAAKHVRKCGLAPDKRTPYPNDVFFAPSHVMLWLNIIFLRLSDDGLSAAEIIEQVRSRTPVELKKNATDYLNAMFDHRQEFYTNMFQKTNPAVDYKEELKWDDKVDAYDGNDTADFSPSTTPTDLGLKGMWSAPFEGDAPEQPSAPYKTVCDNDLGNVRPEVLALPAPSQLVAAAAGGTGGAAGPGVDPALAAGSDVAPALAAGPSVPPGHVTGSG